MDFYTEVLGLRLIKLTVNFDDPGSYHFYFGDRTGSPGTLLTFFPWPGAPQGRRGAGEVLRIALAIPAGSADGWQARLADRGARREDDTVSFEDPDGLAMRLVEVEAEGDGILGMHGVELTVRAAGPTMEMLTALLGATPEGERGVVWPNAGIAARASVLESDEGPARCAVGSVHHIAWRVASDAEQLAARERLVAAGFPVTPVRDRSYFRSIYFHEPGGVLFEIATDGPGFTIDENEEELGSSLRLPPRLEPMRARIEEVLPRVRLPA